MGVLDWSTKFVCRSRAKGSRRWHSHGLLMSEEGGLAVDCVAQRVEKLAITVRLKTSVDGQSSVRCGPRATPVWQFHVHCDQVGQ